MNHKPEITLFSGIWISFPECWSSILHMWLIYREWQTEEPPLELEETQRKLGKDILRTEGLLQTWILMWSPPWLQKLPSSGSHKTPISSVPTGLWDCLVGISCENCLLRTACPGLIASMCLDYDKDQSHKIRGYWGCSNFDHFMLSYVLCYGNIIIWFNVVLVRPPLFTIWFLVS